MEKKVQTILERDRMRYKLFVQGNITLTAMTQLFVAIELKLKIEEVRLEFGKNPRTILLKNKKARFSAMSLFNSLLFV